MFQFYMVSSLVSSRNRQKLIKNDNTLLVVFLHLLFELFCSVQGTLVIMNIQMLMYMTSRRGNRGSKIY